MKMKCNDLFKMNLRRLTKKLEKMTNKIFLSFFLLLLSFTSHAEILSRLDDFHTENILKPNFLVHLYITENCSVCNKQIETLKGCMGPDKIAVYLEGTSEEKLRMYVRRKKIPFKTFHLTGSAKSLLKFGKESPSLSFKSEGLFKNLHGFQNCEKISSYLKF